MLSSTLRRLAVPLLAAVVTVLVLAATGGATHQMGFGHTNALTAGEATTVTCNVNQDCIYVGNGNAGASARSLTGSHDNTDGTAPGAVGQTLSNDDLAEGVRGWVVPALSGAGSAGVRGINNGTGANGIGVWGSQNGAGIGVYGQTPSGLGVVGTSDTSIAMLGASGMGHGVVGTTGGAAGAGVIGANPNGFAGYFLGDVHVAGTLTKSAGAFRIDHPLDPQHKWLQHAFVESPDMLNVYNGNVRTDARAFAVVHLPRYFQALNRDFRYQLTVVGTRGWRARVVREVASNRFTIQSDAPFAEVSWQVTGVRQDAYATQHRIQVELPKSPIDQKLRGQIQRAIDGTDSIASVPPTRTP